MFLDLSNLSYYQSTCLAFLISLVPFFFVLSYPQLNFSTAVLGWGKVNGLLCVEFAKTVHIQV